jgi:DNA-directed RNA polymerase specialized sigma24 family protein
VTLGGEIAGRDAAPEELLALDTALDRLAERDAAMARVVELRYFGGLTVEEVAAVTGASVRTVHRSWTAARHGCTERSPPPRCRRKLAMSEYSTACKAVASRDHWKWVYFG